MIKIIVLGYKFTYKGNITIRIDDVFVHISSKGFDICDYNIQDTFLTKDVESITGYSYDQR